MCLNRHISSDKIDKIHRALPSEQQEKKEIEIENNILKYLLPSVGLTAVIIGTVGFLRPVSVNIGVAIFLLVIAILGLGGIAYGVYHLFFRRWKNRTYF